MDPSQPEDSSLERDANASLEVPAMAASLAVDKSMEAVVATPFRYNRLAFLTTVAALTIIILLGIGSFFLGGFHQNTSGKQANSQAADSYAATNLPLQAVKANKQLQLSVADTLAVNGQLQVSNSLVLAPGSQPTNTTTGQIYYDRANNAPYYYDGNQFISLAPTGTPQHVSSVGGVSGSIALGTGLQIVGNQLAVNTNLLQGSTNNTTITNGVTSFDALNGALTLNNSSAAGSTVTINSASTTQMGIAQFNPTDFTDNGNGVVSTIQDISTTANAQFGSLTLNSGDLTLVAGASIFADNLLNSGAGNNLNLSGDNNITFSNQSGSNSFSFPTTGGLNQTLCTTTNNCTAVGAAGGDLTGSYPNPTINKLQGKTLTVSGSPSTGAVLQYNGSAFIDGLITNVNLQAGNFSNITGTGALTSGSIGSGFGTISTGNNIMTTAITQGGIVNATSTLELGGTSINTAGTLSNVAYLNGTGPQTFTGNNQFSGIFLAKNSSNSTTAFQIQNAAGTSNLFTADTTNNQIGIDTSTPGYSLDVNGTFRATSTSSAVFGNGITGGIQLGDSSITKASGGPFIIGSGIVVNTGAIAANSGSNLQLGTFGVGYSEIISGTNGAAIFKNASNSTTAFQVQNSSGNQILTIDTSNNQVVLGKASTLTGQIAFFGSGSANSIALVGPTSPGSGLSLTLPNETGTLCSTGSVCSGYAASSGSGNYIQNGTSTQTANFNIQSANTNSVAAVISGVTAGQTADILEVKGLFGGNKLVVAGDGGTILTGGGGGNPALTVIDPGGTSEAVLIQGSTIEGNPLVVLKNGNNATGDLLQFQNSSGTVLTAVASDGSIKFPNITGTPTLSAGAYSTSGALITGAVIEAGPRLFVGSGSQLIALMSDVGGGVIQLNNGNQQLSGYGTGGGGSPYQFISTVGLRAPTGVFGTTSTAQPAADLEVGANSASDIVGILRGASSQSADLLQLQNSSGNVIGGFSATGQLKLGRASNTVGQINFFGSGSANSIALVGPTSPGSGQTLSLPNETGTLCSTGTVCTGYAPSTGGTGYIRNGTSTQTNANFNIQSASVSSVVAVIQGASNQWADLQQFQNSSGTVVNRVDANGNIGQSNGSALYNATAGLNQGTARVDEPTTNLIINPSFETNTTGWTINSGIGVQDSSWSTAGSKSLRLTGTPYAGALGPTVAAIPGQAYSFRASYNARTLTSSNQLIGRINWLNSSFGSLGSGNWNFVGVGTGTMVDNNEVAPATTAFAQLQFFVGGATTNTDYSIDAVQLEQKAYSTSYTDGSLGTNYAWTGTPQASTSTRTGGGFVADTVTSIQGLGTGGNLTVGGSALFQNSANSTTAFQIQGSTGASATLLTADTTNMRLGVNVTYAAMAVPVQANTSTSTSGGSLAAATYYYKITAIDSAGGETTPSNEKSQVTTGSASTVTITWAPITGAAGYRIYRGTATNTETGYYSTIGTVSGANLTFVDTGATQNNTSATVPGSNTAYTATNVSNNNLQLSVGGNGTPTGQVYISGTVPSVATGSIATGANPYFVYVQGHYAYVANFSSNNLQIFDVSNPSSPVIVGSVGTGGNPFGVYVQGRYAYVTSLASNLLQIVDISNPSSPIVVGSVTAGTDPRAVYVQGRYAYVPNEMSNTIQIFDVSNPSSPLSVGSVASGTGSRHISAQGRYIYVVNDTSNTIQIFDVSNPSSPVIVGSVATGSSPFFIYVQGRYAYVANKGPNTLGIYDISNPANPVSVGSVATGSGVRSMFVQGRFAYAVNQNANTLQIFDVSNPANPVSVGSVATDNGPTSSYVQGRYAYVVNFTSSTLQIFDLGGAYIQQLQTGGLETGTLQTDGNVSVNGDQSIQGGLQTGSSILDSGNLGVSGSSYIQGATSLAGGILGGVTINGLLTPAAPSVTQVGTPGSTNYSYAVAAVSPSGGITPASTATQTTTGNATLTGSNYNQVSWTPISGAVSYNIYRTASSGTPGSSGLIGNTLAASFNDTGISGTTSAPTLDTSGQLTVNGYVNFKNTINSTTAFQIQNATGTSLLSADTTNQTVGIAITPPTNSSYRLAVGGRIYSQAQIDVGGNYDCTGSCLADSLIYIDNFGFKGRANIDGGRFNLSSGGSNSVLSLQENAGQQILVNGRLKVDTTGDTSNGYNNVTAVINANTNQSVDILEVQKAGTNIFNLTNNGAANFQNFTNSTSAFQVQDASGVDVVNVDSTNKNIALNNLSGKGYITFAGAGSIGSGLYFSTQGAFIVNNGGSNEQLQFNVATGGNYNYDINNIEVSRLNSYGLGLGVVPVNSAGLLQLASGSTAANGIAFGTDTNLYRAAASTLKTDGSLLAAGDLQTGSSYTRSLTRTLPTTINNEVDIGSFAFTNGGSSLLVQVTVPSNSFSVSKQYNLPVQYNNTANVWTIANPISDTGSYSGQDFALDINVNGGTAFLRLRRTAGSTAGTAYISITNQGVASDTFTSSSSTSSVSAPITYYSSAVLTQTNGALGIDLQPTNGSGLIQLASGTTAANGIAFGTDTKLYRSSANTLTTDGNIVAGGGTIVLQGSGSGIYEYQTAANNLIRNYLLNSDAQPAFRIAGNGTIQWGPGGSTVTDTNLYRAAAGDLRTDSTLRVVGQNFQAMYGQNAQITLGSTVGGSSPATIYFGSALDTNLYRSAANTLQTDGGLIVGTLGSGGTSVLCSNSGQISSCGSSAGSGSYIYNTSSPQSGADFNISGSGTIGGSLTVTSVNSSQTTPIVSSNSYNNQGYTAGANGYASLFGYQAGNNVSLGSNYGAVLGLNQFYDGTNWYTQNGYIQPSAIKLQSGGINFYTSNINQAGTPGNITPTATLSLSSFGAATFQNSVNSTSAFQLQNAAGTSNLLVADTTNSKIGINTVPSSFGAALQIAGSGGLSISDGGSNFNISNATGLQVITNQTTAWTSLGTTGGAPILNLYNSSNTAVAGFSATGSAFFSPSTNTSTAFQIQNAAGSPQFNVNTFTTSNLLKYPGFESGSFSNAATGWVATAPGTIAQNTTASNTYDGIDSLNLTTTSSNGGAQTSAFTGTVAAGTYYVSFYVMPGSAMNASGFTITLNDGSNHTCSPNSVLSTTNFMRVSCSITTTANLSTLTIAQNDSTARSNIYIDDVQLQISGVGNYQLGTMQLPGTTVTSPAIFQNSANSITAFQVQDTSGNAVLNTDTANDRIGINTASPGATLHIINLNNSANTPSEVLRIQTNNSGPGAGGWIQFADNAVTDQARVLGYDINNYGGGLALYTKPADGNGGSAAQERLRIDAAGNVGINTTSTASARLTVSGTTLVGLINSTTAFQIQNAAGTSNLLVADTTNSLIGIGQTASGGGNALQVTGGITATTGNVNASAGTLQTNATNRIDNSGNLVNIGNLTSSGASTFATTGANGFNFRPGSDNSTAFQIQSSGGTTTLLTADTSSLKITLGSASSTPILLVLGNKNTTGDPTETDGAMYYNSALSEFRCGVGGAWTNCAIDNINHSYSFTDDFLSGMVVNNVSSYNAQNVIGNLNWSLTPAANCSAQYNQPTGPAQSHDHPGVLRLITSTNASAACGLGESGSTAATLFGDTIAADDVIKTTVATGDIGRGKLRVGWTNSVTPTAPTSGAYWEYSNSDDATHWRYCYANNGTATCASTTDTISANTWYNLEIRVISSSAITFIITPSGGTPETHTLTSITYDPGSTNKLSPTIVASATDTTQIFNYVDYFQWRGIITSAGGR